MDDPSEHFSPIFPTHRTVLPGHFIFYVCFRAKPSKDQKLMCTYSENIYIYIYTSWFVFGFDQQRRPVRQHLPELRTKVMYTLRSITSGTSSQTHKAETELECMVEVDKNTTKIASNL